jgi:hypothetical protein
MSQLVFKIMKPSASFHGVDYNEKKQAKGQASLIHMQHFGHLQDGRTQVSRQEMKKYLAYFSQMNTRIKSPQFHAILSCKGQAFSTDHLKDHALHLMQQMGYGDNPLLIYAHTDTKNNHIHIVSSRIGPDGRKIPDKYEGLKANRILSEMLQLDTQQDCQQAIKEALAYRFSSVAQFMLLMERKGYDCRSQQQQISLYKHGTKQGTIPLSDVKQRMAEYHNSPTDVSRIRALILKYKITYDSALLQTGNRYPAKPKNHASSLTTFLHLRFGLEFVFFSGKQHDKPYGYAIIDHGHKTIFKGGEVMSMGQLTGWSSDQKNVNAANTENKKIKGGENDRIDGTDPDRMHSKDMVNLFDHLIQNLEYQVDQDLKQEGVNSKKKKKRDQRQIR